MRAVHDYVSWMLQSAQASTIARSLHWAEMPIKISHLAHDNILRNMTCISEYVLTHTLTPPPNPVPVLLPLTAVCGACYYDPRAADHTCAPRRRARGGESRVRSRRAGAGRRCGWRTCSRRPTRSRAPARPFRRASSRPSPTPTSSRRRSRSASAAAAPPLTRHICFPLPAAASVVCIRPPVPAPRVISRQPLPSSDRNASLAARGSRRASCGGGASVGRLCAPGHAWRAI